MSNELKELERIDHITVDYIFSEDGPIKAIKENYVPRHSQIDAAKQIFELGSGEKYILEGPCGFGKTFAYLIPLGKKILDSKIIESIKDELEANGPIENTQGKVLIVTDGISLQEQLYYKDLPIINDIFAKDYPGHKIVYEIFKGRANYLCPKKMNMVMQGTDIAHNKDEQYQFTSIKNFYRKTETGDMSQLPFMPSFNVLEQVACLSPEECEGRGCDAYGHCYYYKRKKRLEDADIIITNYHMLFSDLESGGNILPYYTDAVFDEAHNTANVYRDFTEKKISLRSMLNLKGKITELFKLSEDAERCCEDTVNNTNLTYTCERLLIHLSQCHRLNTKYKDSRLLQYDSINYDIVDDFYRDLISYKQSFRTLHETLNEQYTMLDDEFDKEAKDELSKVINKVSTIESQIETYIIIIDKVIEKDYSNDVAIWIETDEHQSISLHIKKVKVNKDMYDYFFNSDKNHILTSATLSVGGNFDYVKEELGLNLLPAERIKEYIGESPFDLTKQQLWYLPQNSLAGNDGNFDNMIPSYISSILRVTGGGTLCLFTSIKNMNNVYENLRFEILPFKIIKQGQKPKQQLIEDFTADKNSVLLATKSFFTGIDVQGDSLRCVIIDKFPFPSPGDPIQQKLATEKNAFFKYSIPAMIIDLKQAVGRGVRSITDKCAIVILDGRMSTARYKAKIFNSFPYEKSGTRELEDVRQFVGVINEE